MRKCGLSWFVRYLCQRDHADFYGGSFRFQEEKIQQRLFYCRVSSQFVGWLMNRCFKAFIPLNRMCKLTRPRSFLWILLVNCYSFTNILGHPLDVRKAVRASVRLRLYTMLIITVITISDSISCIKHHQMFHSHNCFHQMTHKIVKQAVSRWYQM